MGSYLNASHKYFPMRFAHAAAALAFLLLIPLFSSAADCTVVSGACASGVGVAALTGTSNSHAAQYGTAGYAYSLCCPNSLMTGAAIRSSCTASEASLNLTLYNASGGHAAWDATGGYANKLCFTPAVPASTACIMKSSCSGGESAVASLAATTNAHAGNATAYANVICCSTSLAQSYVSIECPGDFVKSSSAVVKSSVVLNGVQKNCTVARANVSVPGAVTADACSGTMLITNVTVSNASSYTATASYTNLTAVQCSFWMQPAAASYKAPEADLLLIALLPVLALAFLRWKRGKRSA